MSDPADLLTRFEKAVVDLERRFERPALEDLNAAARLHEWLDFPEPLPWIDLDGVTADEWFFVTTLYGTMTPDGQRTHIRRFFRSLFVEAGHRDIRNFVPGMPEFGGLRAGWMAIRLCRMAAILREASISMEDYAAGLRRRENTATPLDPMPALDQILRDHGATSGKTLSVFIRDCVGGNCFPIDSRVLKELRRYGLPESERQLVSLSLAARRNPRVVARMFYEAGGGGA